MANTIIQLKKSGATGNTPSTLNFGELALNYADGKLFYKNSGGSVVSLTDGLASYSFSTINASSTLILAGSSSDTLSFAGANGITIVGNSSSKTVTVGINPSTFNANVSAYQTVTNATTGTWYPALYNGTSGDRQVNANSALSFNSATGALSATSLNASGTAISQFTDSSGVATPNKTIQLNNGTNWLAFQANAAAGAYNSITTVGDAALWFSNGSGTSSSTPGNLVIAPWSGIPFGLRLNSAANTVAVTGSITSTANITASSGTITASSFSGAGTGLTGTAASLTAGNATLAADVSGGSANQILYQTGAGATSYITAPTQNNTFLNYQTNTGFSWQLANGASVGSSNVSAYQTVTNATTGTWYPALYNGTSGDRQVNANNALSFNAATGALNIRGSLGISEVGGSGARLLISSSGSGAVINQNDNSNIVLQTSGVTRLTIAHSSGDLTSTGNITASSGTITASSFSGAGTGLTGTAASLNVGGTALNITQYTINQNLGTTNSPTFNQVVANSASGRVQLGTDAGGSITLGSLSNTALPTTPYIDFNTSANVVDYDVRILASGNNSINGSGNLNIYASNTIFSGIVYASSFSGAGTGLTGTASSLTAGLSTDVAGGSANQILYQTGAGATSYITAPTQNNTFLNYTTGGGFSWQLASGASVGTANVSTYQTVTNATTGTWYPALYNGTSGDRQVYANNAFAFNAATGFVGIGTISPSEKLHVSGNQVIETNSSNAALRITQTGTGNALLVEDSANPDSSPFVIEANGRVLVGTTTALQTSSGLNPKILTTVNGSTEVGVYLQAVGAMTNAPQLVFTKTRGASAGDYTTAISSGDDLGFIPFEGSDGVSALRRGAIISVEADDTFSNTSAPSRITFLTSANGSITPSSRMTIISSGNVGIGTNSPIYKLDVAGTANTGALSATSFSGAGTGLTGTASSLTAGLTTDVAGGSANAIVYQLTSGDTRFITGPSTNNTFLNYQTNGGFTWQPVITSAGGTFNGSVTINGDLNVSGNTTFTGNTSYINVTNLEVNDPIIYLGANNYTSDLVSIGFVGNYFNGANNLHTGLFRQHASNNYYLFTGVRDELDNVNVISTSANGFMYATLYANINSPSIVATTFSGSTITLDSLYLLDANSFTTSSTSQVSVDSFASATYRSAKYQAQITSGTSYHVIELLLVHDGTTVYLSQYGEIFTGVSLGTFDATITSGTLNLLFTPTNAITTIKVAKNLITV